MTAVLVVTKDRKQLAKVSITKKAFVIGRSKQCDLPLEEEVASRQHVEITQVDGTFWVRDLRSRNGTSLNGKKIDDRRPLKDGDEISIGTTRLAFHADANESADEGATRAVSASDLEIDAPGQKVVPKKSKGAVTVSLKITQGPLEGGVFRDWEGDLTIGRGLDNHVVLLDDAVSGHHARIVQDDDRYFLEDLGSANGTFLDGVKVQRSRLANGQKIKISVSTLLFERVDLEKRKRTWLYTLAGTTLLLAVALTIKWLQPPDIAGEQIAKARQFYDQDELPKALEAYQTALKTDPTRAEAKLGFKQVKAILDAREILSAAEAAAAVEDYDKAQELCYRVLRDFPNHERARELDTIIKSIENAKIAFAARNWVDAVRLLGKARDAYPKSNLIKLRLTEAERELFAQQNVVKAQDAFQHQQPDMAESLLITVPTNSVYYTEAREYLDKINSDRRISASLGNAQSLFRAGQVTETLTEIEKGLQAAPESATLLGFRDHVRKVEPLVEPLAAAESMNEPDNVDALLQNLKSCDSVMQIEEDPLNTLRRRAEAARVRIAQRLQEVSRANAAKADEVLQAGNRKEALRLYGLAMKADPTNQTVAQAFGAVRKKIVSECRALYQKGIVHEELQQLDLARNAFQEVLAIGIPGEEYYERAARKLKESAP